MNEVYAERELGVEGRVRKRRRSRVNRCARVYWNWKARIGRCELVEGAREISALCRSGKS